VEVVPEQGTTGKGPMSGTIIAQGGAISGWSFYVKDGKAKFTYNLLGLQMFTTEAEEPVPPGKHQVRAEFAYDGGGVAKGGDVSLYYGGEKVGEGGVAQFLHLAQRSARPFPSGLCRSVGMVISTHTKRLKVPLDVEGAGRALAEHFDPDDLYWAMVDAHRQQ
jgi:hypothetical protein